MNTLYDKGYKSQKCIDFSKQVINQRISENKHRKIEYLTCDCSNMSIFKNQEFDLIIDKATFDSMIHVTK